MIGLVCGTGCISVGFETSGDSGVGMMSLGNRNDEPAGRMSDRRSMRLPAKACTRAQACVRSDQCRRIVLNALRCLPHLLRRSRTCRGF